MSWESYTPAEPLPRWWPATVKRIIKRDPWCRCLGCPKCFLTRTSDGCRRLSKAADHIVPRSQGGSHSDKNLRGVCSACHGHKTAREGNEAKAARKRPTGFFEETHPGKL
jgi:5-methylcytosine-specific restriction endonuclease McrA